MVHLGVAAVRQPAVQRKGVILSFHFVLSALRFVFSVLGMYIFR